MGSASRTWRRVAGRPAVVGALAALIAVWHYAAQAVTARVVRIEAFDGGILTSTIAYTAHGRVPIADFYEPYGVGIGIPGLLPRLLGADGVLAERLTYAVFGALASALVVVLVARWVPGWVGVALAAVAGLASLAASTPRYAAPWCAVLGCALLVLRASRRGGSSDLATLARTQPRTLDAAAVVLSLAAWMRVEYAAFPLAWAIVLLVAAPGSTGRRRALVAAVAALAPSILVVLAGGAHHLWWVARYDLLDFRRARGIPIDWGMGRDWLRAVAHGHLADPIAGVVVATYGVAVATVAAAVALAAWRVRRRRRPRGGATARGAVMALLLAIAAIVLYGQSARFSASYGQNAVVVLTTPGLLLAGTGLSRLTGRARPAQVAVVALIALAFLPVVRPQLPDAVRNQWRQRPATTMREPIPHYNRIAMWSADQDRALAALPAVWHALGLDGRPTLSIGRTNTTAWGNDTLVGALLDATPAAWTLTYDPGLVNRDEVQREVVGELCRNRAPLVQAETTYPDQSNFGIQWGSPRLDEHVALNYRVAAVAGYYRILLPTGCRHVEDVDVATLARLRDARLAAGELPEAGALALARLQRSGDPQDAAVAVLGGFGHEVPERALPRGDVGAAIWGFANGRRDPAAAARAVLAAQHGPPGLMLAAEQAWVSGHQPGEADEARVFRAMLRFAVRHPRLGSAITMLRSILPGGPSVFRPLARAGASGVEVVRWRFDTQLASGGRLHELAALGRLLVAFYDRRRDPLQAADVELAVARAIYPVDASCAGTYLTRADARPGIWLPPHGGPAPCRDRALAPGPLPG